MGGRARVGWDENLNSNCAVAYRSFSVVRNFAASECNLQRSAQRYVCIAPRYYPKFGKTVMNFRNEYE